MTETRTAGVVAVLGARNLGGAVARHFLARGWSAAAIARSEESLAGVRDAGALGVPADAADPEGLAGALARVRDELGGLDAVVNAVSASRRREGEPFGGGPLADATLEGFRGWGSAVAEQGFVFLSEGARALRRGGAGGALVQVTGGSARRAMPGKGPWSAGAFAVRALTQAAALELREEGIHVALLVVDATIESAKTAPATADTPRDALADQDEVARAAFYLATQDRRAMSHELVVTPAGDRWVP